MDVNLYATKKTVAQGMMDLALLTANANQLRYVLNSHSSTSMYYYVNIVFICASIVLQVCCNFIVYNAMLLFIMFAAMLLCIPDLRGGI